MSFEKSGLVWMDGRFLPWRDATVHVSAHGLHYGTGVFEGLRCYETESGPAIFRLAEHLARFYASAAAYGIEVPFEKSELESAVRGVVERNGFSSCYVRPVAFYGSRTLGLNAKGCPVHVAVLAWPWGPYLGEEGRDSGVRLAVSRWRKFDLDVMPATAKGCGQYLNSILALQEALSRGYDEAILLDSDGNIAEGSGENVFFVRRGRLITNDERSPILLGVTRDTVLQIARDIGIDVEVRNIRLQELLDSDEAFLTGTAAEVTPIREIEGKTIGGGSRGPLTNVIQQWFFRAALGSDERYRHWLAPTAFPLEIGA